jgi:hypothetical protein
MPVDGLYSLGHLKCWLDNMLLGDGWSDFNPGEVLSPWNVYRTMVWFDRSMFL